VEIRTTKQYWKYLIDKKHRVMQEKEDIVIQTLNSPDEIRKSKIDDNIFLYYKQFDRLYCVIAKHMGQKGYLITAYPTDRVKEGEVIWIK